MNSASKSRSIELSGRYAAALRRQLALKSGASSRPARRLGREALTAGLDMFDLARIHEQALIAVLHPGPPSGNSDGMSKRAAKFFIEALAPIEKSHRTAKKNGDLAATHRRLRREIARREAVQEALERSEQHYSQLLETSRRDQGRLRRLSHGILSAQEEERKRISRELHDEIGQTLTAINVRLATLQKEAAANTKGLKSKIASTQRLLEKSLNIVHRFARALRPALLDDLGLIPALHSYMRDFTKRTHIPIRVKAVAAVEGLSNDKRTVLYRVAQEALTNVAKHANASLVKVSLQIREGVVCMDIHDNGKSFRVERVLSAHNNMRRLGVLGMRERLEMVGGSLTVESEPGEGTTVCARIPLGNNH